MAVNSYDSYEGQTLVTGLVCIQNVWTSFSASGMKSEHLLAKLDKVGSVFKRVVLYHKKRLQNHRIRCDREHSSAVCVGGRMLYPSAWSLLLAVLPVLVLRLLCTMVKWWPLEAGSYC